MLDMWYLLIIGAIVLFVAAFYRSWGIAFLSGFLGLFIAGFQSKEIRIWLWGASALC